MSLFIVKTKGLEDTEIPLLLSFSLGTFPGSSKKNPLTIIYILTFIHPHTLPGICILTLYLEVRKESLATAPREEQPSSTAGLAGGARGLSGFRKERGGSGTVLESQLLLGRWDTGTATPAHPPTCHVTLGRRPLGQTDTTHGALSGVGYGLSVTGDPTSSF